MSTKTEQYLSGDIIKIFFVTQQMGVFGNNAGPNDLFRVVGKKKDKEPHYKFFPKIQWEICHPQTCHYWDLDRDEGLCDDCEMPEATDMNDHCSVNHKFGFDFTGWGPLREGSVW
tara:strand:+ start:627 stop:971 length:345 start_codon:yes stop_codon:yes gene_type:complete